MTLFLIKILSTSPPASIGELVPPVAAIAAPRDVPTESAMTLQCWMTMESALFNKRTPYKPPELFKVIFWKRMCFAPFKSTEAAEPRPALILVKFMPAPLKVIGRNALAPCTAPRFIEPVKIAAAIFKVVAAVMPHWLSNVTAESNLLKLVPIAGKAAFMV